MRDRLSGVTALLPLVWMGAVALAFSLAIPAVVSLIAFVALAIASVAMVVNTMNAGSPERVVIVGNEVHAQHEPDGAMNFVAEVDRITRLTAQYKHLYPAPGLAGILRPSECSIMVELTDGSEHVLIDHVNKLEDARSVAEHFYNEFGIPSPLRGLETAPDITATATPTRIQDTPTAESELRSALQEDAAAEAEPMTASEEDWDFPAVDPDRS